MLDDPQGNEYFSAKEGFLLLVGNITELQRSDGTRGVPDGDADCDPPPPLSLRDHLLYHHT